MWSCVGPCASEYVSERPLVRHGTNIYKRKEERINIDIFKNKGRENKYRYFFLDEDSLITRNITFFPFLMWAYFLSSLFLNSSFCSFVCQYPKDTHPFFYIFYAQFYLFFCFTSPPASVLNKVRAILSVLRYSWHKRRSLENITLSLLL